MSDLRPRSTNVPKGLETTRDTSSSRLAWTEYLNSRTAEDSDARRSGMVRLHRFAAASVLMDFDATNDLVTLTTDARVISLGKKATMELLFQTDTISSNRFVMGRSGAGATGVTIQHKTDSTVVTVATDSNGGTTTLTHTGIGAGVLCAYQLVRDGTSLVVKINGTSQTGTMDAAYGFRDFAAVLGADNGGTFYDGRIDFLRIFRYPKTNQYDGWARLVNPRAPGVVVDWVLEPDANGYVLDRGPLGLHLATTGSPATNVAPLAVNPVPVLGVASNLDTSSTQKAYIRAAGALYPVVVK